MKLGELLNVEKLCAHCNNHVVNTQHHPALPLTIYNYGQKATFENIWDDVTTLCRGLIVETHTEELVARPFSKFFNLNTSYRPETGIESLPSELPEITEKLDGSLGILYRYKGFTGIATRGSFASDQATWASAWYNRELSHAVWPEGWTPLFEIIYPENRVVVHYPWEGLTLLALVNMATGEEMTRGEVENIGWQNGCKVVTRFDKSIEECQKQENDNFEGYVLTWHVPGRAPLKIKVKLAEYMRLHHLLTGISPKEIWRMLQNGESFNDLVTNVPEHYSAWINSWKSALQSEYGRIEQKARAVYANCPLPKNGADKESRKKLAAYFTAGELVAISGVLFKMLDGQSYEEIIWKMCRPMISSQQCFRPTNE